MQSTRCPADEELVGKPCRTQLAVPAGRMMHSFPEMGGTSGASLLVKHKREGDGSWAMV